MPSRSGDKQLLSASIVHAAPSQLAALKRDRRPWVRRIAEAEDARRAREAADEVVCREPLREMVTTFVAEWKRTRPPTGGQFAAANRERNPVVPLGPIEWLSSTTGLPRGTVENLTRTNRTGSGVVAYDVADAIVAAIGCPQAMYDGTLPMTTRSSPCCSGSTASRTATA